MRVSGWGMRIRGGGLGCDFLEAFVVGLSSSLDCPLLNL
jgi:hypothetical protein